MLVIEDSLNVTLLVVCVLQHLCLQDCSSFLSIKRHLNMYSWARITKYKVLVHFNTASNPNVDQFCTKLWKKALNQVATLTNRGLDALEIQTFNLQKWICLSSIWSRCAETKDLTVWMSHSKWDSAKLQLPFFPPKSKQLILKWEETSVQTLKLLCNVLAIPHSHYWLGHSSTLYVT